MEHIGSKAQNVDEARPSMKNEEHSNRDARSERMPIKNGGESSLKLTGNGSGGGMQEAQVNGVHEEVQKLVADLARAKNPAKKNMDPDTLHKLTKVAMAFFKLKLVKNDNIPAQIQKGMYLGSLGAANNEEWLLAKGVTHVLAVGNGLPTPFEKSFTYLKIDALDNPKQSLSQYFEQTNDFIQQGIASGGILIHCFAGKSRSTTLVSAYLIHQGLGLEEALARIKQSRPQAQPNEGFMRQLQEYASSCASSGRQ